MAGWEGRAIEDLLAEMAAMRRNMEEYDRMVTAQIQQQRFIGDITRSTNIWWREMGRPPEEPIDPRLRVMEGL